jgi:hypothetical protein
LVEVGGKVDVGLTVADRLWGCVEVSKSVEVKLVEVDGVADKLTVSGSVKVAEKAVDGEIVVDTVLLALAASVSETEQLVVWVSARPCQAPAGTAGGAGRQRSPLPPARHEQTPEPELAFTLHELFGALSGPKQSALGMHDPQSPASTAPLGSPSRVTTPSCRLQRWKNLPLPIMVTVNIEYPLP